MALFDSKKNQISALQKSIDDKNRTIGILFDEIGRLYYKQYKDMNADVARDINARCENISTLYVEIEECRLKILYERGFKECANCKKENLLEHAYCSACGQKFPDSNDISVVTRVDPVTLGPVGINYQPAASAPVQETFAASAPVQETFAASAPVQETFAAGVPVQEAEAFSAPVQEVPAVDAPIVEAEEAVTESAAVAVENEPEFSAPDASVENVIPVENEERILSGGSVDGETPDFFPEEKN